MTEMLELDLRVELMPRKYAFDVLGPLVLIGRKVATCCPDLTSNVPATGGNVSKRFGDSLDPEYMLMMYVDSSDRLGRFPLSPKVTLKAFPPVMMEFGWG